MKIWTFKFFSTYIWKFSRDIFQILRVVTRTALGIRRSLPHSISKSQTFFSCLLSRTLQMCTIPKFQNHIIELIDDLNVKCTIREDENTQLLKYIISSATWIICRGKIFFRKNNRDGRYLKIDLFEKNLTLELTREILKTPKAGALSWGYRDPTKVNIWMLSKLSPTPRK